MRMRDGGCCGLGAIFFLLPPKRPPHDQKADGTLNEGRADREQTENKNMGGGQWASEETKD